MKQLSRYKLNKISNNLDLLFNMANNEQITQGKDWYKLANYECTIIAIKYNIDLYKVIQVVSALSPRNKWERNLIDANNLIDAFTSNKDINSFKVCTFNTNKFKAWNILKDNLDITNNSLKTFNFVNSMLLMNNALTIDVWHLRACFLNDIKINNASIGKIAYKQIKELTIKKAANVGLKSYEYQAILWLTTQEYINNNFRNK